MREPMNSDQVRNYVAQQEPVDSDFYHLALHAQAAHETGNFTSDLWNDHANAFGMMAVQRNEQFRTGEHTTHEGDMATYATPLDSVRDRVHLDSVYGRKMDLSDGDDVVYYMLQVQNAGYAADKRYVSSWYRHFRQKNPEVDISPGIDELAKKVSGSGKGSMTRYLDNFESYRAGQTADFDFELNDLFKPANLIVTAAILFFGWKLWKLLRKRK